jgi:hypothetical protein
MRHTNLAPGDEVFWFDPTGAFSGECEFARYTSPKYALIEKDGHMFEVSIYDLE